MGVVAFTGGIALLLGINTGLCHTKTTTQFLTNIEDGFQKVQTLMRFVTRKMEGSSLHDLIRNF